MRSVDVGILRERFNAASNSVRVVSLVSPTCLVCQYGAGVLRTVFDLGRASNVTGFTACAGPSSPSSIVPCSACFAAAQRRAASPIPAAELSPPSRDAARRSTSTCTSIRWFPMEFPGGVLASARALPDPAVRASISTLAHLAPEDVEPGVRKLEEDLASGAWHEHHAALLGQDEVDFGYRLIVAAR